MHWTTVAVELGLEHPCCSHTRQFFYLHGCLKFDMCDDRHCARPISSSLATQTTALGVPTQKLVVNKRLIIQNSALPHGSNRGDDHCRAHVTGASQGTPCPGCRGTWCDAFPRKRHRPEGEGRQPLAPPGSTALESGVRGKYQEGRSTSSGSALLAGVALAQRSLEQEIDMTDQSNRESE